MLTLEQDLVTLYAEAGFPVWELLKSSMAGELADPGDPLFGDFCIADYAVLTKEDILLDDDACDAVYHFEREHDVEILKLSGTGFNRSLLAAEGFEPVFSIEVYFDDAETTTND